MYLQAAACNELTTERKEIAMEKIPYKIYLSEDEMPKYWFNLRAKMKELPEPFVNPGTGEYCTKEELLPVFCEELVDQELNTTD